MSACEFAAQAVRMEMEKVADAPGHGHGRGRGCSGGSNHLRHAHHLNAPLECGVKSARDSSKKYAELAKYGFFFAALGQTAAWSRLVGRHRSQKRC